MSPAFLRNGCKAYHSLRNVLHRYSIADSIGSPILGHQSHQQRLFRPHAQNPHSIYRKSRELELLSPPNTLSSPLSSTAAASSSKIRFVGWYLEMVKSRPILTKSVTCAFIYTAADLSSQTIVRSSSEPYDIVRTLRMAGYGMIILGPTLHFWFNFVSKVLPKRDLVTTLKKIVMGQTLYGPVMTVVFFSVNAALQGENGAEIISRLKRDLVPTMVSGVMYWPICDFVTFKFIPVYLQPLVSNSFSYLWTVYITYMASLEKCNHANQNLPMNIWRLIL